MSKEHERKDRKLEEKVEGGNEFEEKVKEDKVLDKEESIKEAEEQEEG